MNKLLLLIFAFAVSMSVHAQKRKASGGSQTLKSPRNLSEVLESNTFLNTDVNFTKIQAPFLASKKRAIQKHVDTSSFFALKQGYTTAGPSGFTIQPYFNQTNDSLEVTYLGQTIHNPSNSKYTLNGVGLVLQGRNKTRKSDVIVRIYDKDFNVVASASNQLNYTTSQWALYYFNFDKPVTTTEDLTFYVEGKNAYDTIRVYTSGAYRNLAISCNITGKTMTLVSPAPTSPANLGTGFWVGQEISGVGILPGTKIAGYNQTTKVYTLTQDATDGSNIVVTGTNLTFDAYKNSAFAEYYKFPVLSDNQPDLSQTPTYDKSAIHGIAGVGPTDGHVYFYPIVEYEFEPTHNVSNTCLGASNEVVVTENKDNPYFAIAKNPILNKMAFYTFLDSKNYYHGVAYTKSKSFYDTLYQGKSDLKITYNASDITKNDTLIVGNYLWKYGYRKPFNSPSGFSNTFLLSSKINLATTSDSAKTKMSVDGKAGVVATGGIAPYTYLWSNDEDTTDIVVAAGKHVITVTDKNGCQAMDTVNVPFMVPSTSKTEVTSCDKYVWNDSTYTESGIYTFTSTGAKGNDSIATLALTINKSDNITLTEVACGSFEWNDSTYTASGVYVFNGKNVKGCDSIVTLNLTINQPTVSTINETACVSYTWKDSTFTKTGVYTLKTINAKGCDSIITLNLTVNQPSASTVSETACESFVWNGTTYTKSGAYEFITKNAIGCDSIVTLNLTINNTTTSTTNYTANNSYEWNGKTYTESGFYEAKLVNAKGCDSIAKLILTVNTPGKSTTIETACDKYVWNDSTYTTSGTYVFKTTGINGNDSTATLLLTVNKSHKITISEVACGSFEWNDSTYTASGTYVFNGKNAKGCDSIVTLKLTINQPSASTETKVACGSFTWKDSTYTSSGSYTFKTINAKGCDSIVTLNLTINQPSVSILNETVCGSYTWKDSTFAKSGVYTLKTLNAKGCDSTITLNLTVNQPSALTVTETACGSYTWKDSTYTTSGSYTFKTTNAKGCDSIVTLNLTINQPSASTVTETACGSYTWKDSTFAKSGVYTLKTLNAKGCDSTITLNLTVNQPSASTVTETACESFVWNGTTYKASGVYTFNSKNAKGCDSIVTLNLTVNQPSVKTLTEVACGSFKWNDSTYTKSGSYTFKAKTAKGCDSIVTLNLTINTIPAVTASVQNGSLAASTANATYQWVNCDANNAVIANETKQTYLPTQTGNYAVKVSSNGCEATSACVKFEAQTTGLVDANQVAFSIYPNPNQGVFNIAGLPTGTYKIMNLMGAEVFQFTVESTDAQLLNLSHLAKGVYQVTSDAVKIMHNKVVITD